MDNYQNLDPIKKLETAAELFLCNVKGTRSPHTFTAYKTTLSDFVRFFSESPEFNGSDPGFVAVMAWRDGLRERGLSPNTRRQYLTILHSFFDFACDPICGGWYDQNPVVKWLKPTEESSPRRQRECSLTAWQVIRLWRYDKAPGCHRETWPRNYAVVILLLTVGLQNAELRALTPADLDWEDEMLNVTQGRANGFRRIDFPPIAQSAVRLYLASGIRPKDVPDTAPLFGTTSPKEFGARVRGGEWAQGSAQWLNGIVLRHVKAVTGVDGITTEDLRHVGASLDLNSGLPLDELQYKLGHRDIKSTQRAAGMRQGRAGRGRALLVYEAQDNQVQINNAILAEATGQQGEKNRP